MHISITFRVLKYKYIYIFSLSLSLFIYIITLFIAQGALEFKDITIYENHISDHLILGNIDSYREF